MHTVGFNICLVQGSSAFCNQQTNFLRKKACGPQLLLFCKKQHKSTFLNEKYDKISSKKALVTSTYSVSILTDSSENLSKFKKEFEFET